MTHYGLVDLFKDYQFNGVIWLRDGRTPSFELEVFDYIGCEKVFVGSGRDIRGLSAIIGKIEQQTEKLALVKFKQIFDSQKPINFNCELSKTSDDVFLQGTYKDPKDKNNYQISLAIAPRRRGFSIGWKDPALEVELY